MPREQRVSGIRRTDAARLLSPVERERVRLKVVAPERVLEPFAQAARPSRSHDGGIDLAERSAPSGAAADARERVALDLAQRDRRFRQRAVRVEHRIERVLPTLLDQAVRRAARILDEAVAVAGRRSSSIQSSARSTCGQIAP